MAESCILSIADVTDGDSPLATLERRIIVSHHLPLHATLLLSSPLCLPRYRTLDTSACHNSGIGAGSLCLYQVSYGDGSFTVEDFVTETLTLGDSAPITSIDIGCDHDNEGLFVDAAGLLALVVRPLSFPSQIFARSFSYCLIDHDSPACSTLELGDGATSSAAMATMTPSSPTSIVSFAASPSSSPQTSMAASTISSLSTTSAPPPLPPPP